MKKPNKCKKVTLIVLITVLCIAALAAAGYGANRLYIASATPEEYMVTGENYFDYQGNNLECSGYASAYVIRSLGMEADGHTLYEQFENKNDDGTLAPLYLAKNLKKMGYKCRLRVGTLTDLKYHVSRGTPVIAFVKVTPFQDALHYFAVVGYDENYIYVADSVKNRVNSATQTLYNRKISTDDFKVMWKDTGHLFDNIFLTIKK
ncbi:MAG: C39 family peptidase [Clostridia bacterium]|nr:C39 family peptidase [Clostridia bacterium]